MLFESRKSREKRMKYQDECVDMFLNESPAKSWRWAKQRRLPKKFIQKLQQLSGDKYEWLRVMKKDESEFKEYAREELKKANR